MVPDFNHLEDTMVTPNPSRFINSIKKSNNKQKINEADNLFNELTSFKTEYKNLNTNNLVSIATYSQRQDVLTYNMDNLQDYDETLTYLLNPMKIDSVNSLI